MADIDATRGAAILTRLDRLPVWPYGTKILLLIGAGYFFAYFDIVTIGLALPVITEQFGISSSLASMAVTSSLIGYIAGALIDSRIADVRGRRVSLLISVGLFTVGTIGAALSPNIVWLVVFRFIAGMGIGAEIAAVTTYVGELAPKHLRGRATSIVGFMAFAGFAAVPIVARVLVPAFDSGWRVLFLVGAAGGLTVGLLRREMPPSARWLVDKGRFDEAEAAVATAERRVEGRPLLAEPEPEVDTPTRLSRPALLVLFTVIWFIYYIGNYGWLTMAPTLLTEHAGFTLTSSLTFLVITGIGFLAGAAAASFVGDRITRRTATVIAAMVWAAALLGIGLIGTPSAVMGFGFIASGTIGYLIPLLYAYTAEHFPTRNRATSVATADGIGHLGGAAAPPLVLFFAHATGFEGAFVMMAATGVATALLLLLTPRHE